LDRSEASDLGLAPRQPETLLLAGVVAIVGYLDFHDAVPGLFLVFPFLLLTTFQGRLLGTTTAGAAVATVAIWSTFTGHGPIATFVGTNITAKIQFTPVWSPPGDMVSASRR